MDNFKEHRRSLSTAKNSKIGSFVAIVGDLYEEGNDKIEIFIVIDKFKFKIESNNIIDAVDFCYKSFFALGEEFPCECKHIWYFLQVYIYKNDVNALKPYAVVDKFIVELDKVQLENVEDTD